jgi:hypothetical protein
MWLGCYETGDPFLGDADDVEAAARWEGEPGALCRALVEAGGKGLPGFIEPAPDKPVGHYQVHDLYANAPEYVKKRMLREMARNERGKTTSELRSEAGKKGRAVQLAEKENKELRTSGGQAADKRRQMSAWQGANGGTPAPAPAPAPAPPRAPGCVREEMLPPKAWNAGSLEAVWIDVLRKRPATVALVALADRIASTAALRTPPQEPEKLARALVAAFPELRARYREIGWKVPSLSVAAFERNFEHLEAWIDGEKPSNGEEGGGSAEDEGPRGPSPAEMMREREERERREAAR